LGPARAGAPWPTPWRRRGKRILLLERGDFLTRELENWNPKPVFVTGRYISKDTWFDRDGKSFQPQIHYFVGGATKMYGAALYRLRPAGLRGDQARRRDLPGLAAVLRRLRAVVSAAEQLYQVHGEHGEDPTEGHWSKQYPWPPVSHEPRLQQISDGLAKGGWHPFHAPCGILLNEADRPRSTCIRCAWCDGYPCLVHAKSDAEVIAVRPVLGRENVTLVCGAEVTRLETDSSGRTVTGVGCPAAASGGVHRRHRGHLRRRRQQRQDPAQLGQ
jgi:hypothetical protein